LKWGFELGGVGVEGIGVTFGREVLVAGRSQACSAPPVTLWEIGYAVRSSGDLIRKRREEGCGVDRVWKGIGRDSSRAQALWRTWFRSFIEGFKVIHVYWES
jgi:hypothetical protein